MMLTPRQISAFLDFSNQEKELQLMLGHVAAQGDSKSIEQARKVLHGRQVQSHDRQGFRKVDE